MNEMSIPGSIESRSVCEACGTGLVEKLPSVVDPQTRERFAIVGCPRCGLGKTLPQPEALSPYYGPAYHGGRHGFTAWYCVQRRLRLLRHAAGRGAGRRLLDVGCGDGAFLVSARRDGWEVAGTEMNPSLARAAGIKVWTQFDEAAALAPFACVTAWHSLEHLRSPREVIRQAVGLLEPGGVLLVAVPNAEGLQARMYGSKWFHLDVPRHLYHFGPRSLTMLLEGAGLEVVRRVHLEVEIDMFGWTQSALNCISEEPNVFFNHLTGRPSKAGAALKWSHFAAGTLITAMAGPLTAIGALAGRGAVLVMTARKPRSNHGVARAA